MGRLASNIVIATAAVLCICWALLITLPFGWHRKSTLIWNFNVGLYHVSVDRGIGGSIAHGLGLGADLVTSKVKRLSGSQKDSNFVQNAISKLTEGDESLRYYRDMFCSTSAFPLVQTNCQPWDFLLWGSWVLILCTIITIILLLTACAFWWYYWAEEARKTTRMWAISLFAAAPCVQLLGLGVYVGLTFNFGRWLTEYALSSGSSTFSIVFVMSCLLWVFTWTPILLITTCGGTSDLEDVEEDFADERRAMMQGYDDESGYDEYGQAVPYAQEGYAQDPYAMDPYAQQQMQPPHQSWQSY